MKNEFGEEIYEVDLIEYTKRIRRLPDNKIDELWFKCGFNISDNGSSFKAIRKSEINKIRKSFDSAKEVVKKLLMETKINEFRKTIFLFRHSAITRAS